MHDDIIKCQSNGMESGCGCGREYLSPNVAQVLFADAAEVVGVATSDGWVDPSLEVVVGVVFFVGGVEGAIAGVLMEEPEGAQKPESCEVSTHATDKIIINITRFLFLPLHASISATLPPRN